MVKSFSRYLKEVRVEMAKVVWPSFRELVGSTIIVMFLITLLALYLFGVDWGLKWLAQYVYTSFSVMR